MRDEKGRFVKNHPLLGYRDKSTGRFIKTPMKSKYDKTRYEVDAFLRSRGDL